MARDGKQLPELNKQAAAARLLLDYAVGQGLIDDPAIVEPIVKIEAELQGAAIPNSDAIADFLKAYNRLSKLTGEVSAASLSAEARSDQLRTRHIYLGVLVCLLILSMPITTISAVGGQLVDNANSAIIAMCKDYPVMYCASNTEERSAAYDTSPAVVNNISTRTTSIWGTLKAIAILSDLTGSEKAKLNEIWVDDKGNVWAEFKDIYYESFPITENFKLIYGTLSSYAVPILFAMLGAVTFGLRDLRQRTYPPTWISRGESLATLRIVIAGLAGYLITAISGITSEVKFSPILIAFVVGYSLDVFFVLLDTLVAQIKGAKSA